MSNFVSKAVKTVTKPFKSVFDNPVNFLTFGAGALLTATGLGAPLGTAMMIGGGVGAAASGSLGKHVQDIATMGASAQQRYAKAMVEAYNSAQREQSKIAEEQNRQNLLQQIRATRIARAMNLADYAGEEGVKSSGALGNLGSIGSQYLSGTTSAVTIGRAQNAYQSYMNLYNMYQTKAQNAQIAWNNRLNLLNFGLSVYGQGQQLQTAQLGNYYASLKNADAWSNVYSAQETASKIPTSWTGMYLSHNG